VKRKKNKSNFADKVIEYHFDLTEQWKLPKGFELIQVFDQSDTQIVFSKFYKKYFSDQSPRKLIVGINPGRFGAGVTGVPFTDPHYLEESCKIKNDFPKRKELSAIYIDDLIMAMGGHKKFYSEYYISSVCPLGFIKNGINANYYDDPKLTKAVKKHIVRHLNEQIQLGCETKKVYSLGKGKNYKFLKKLNQEINLFDEVVPLPHPRWVMQYKLKHKAEILEQTIQALRD